MVFIIDKLINTNESTLEKALQEIKGMQSRPFLVPKVLFFRAKMGPFASSHPEDASLSSAF